MIVEGKTRRPIFPIPLRLLPLHLHLHLSPFPSSPGHGQKVLSTRPLPTTLNSASKSRSNSPVLNQKAEHGALTALRATESLLHLDLQDLPFGTDVSLLELTIFPDLQLVFQAAVIALLLGFD